MSAARHVGVAGAGSPRDAAALGVAGAADRPTVRGAGAREAGVLS